MMIVGHDDIMSRNIETAGEQIGCWAWTKLSGMRRKCINFITSRHTRFAPGQPTKQTSPPFISRKHTTIRTQGERLSKEILAERSHFYLEGLSAKRKIHHYKWQLALVPDRSSMAKGVQELDMVDVFDISSHI
jgi:hypothetical protein